MDKYIWDIFICHASEDKDEVVRPLANELTARELRVWLDEGELRLGDSLRTEIDEGLVQSRFGVVILSPSFFSKPWAKSELDGLMAREKRDEKIVLLPVWHNMTPDSLLNQSPMIAGRFATNTRKGLSTVASEIASVVHSSGARYRPGAPIFAGRLTKKEFMALPDGSFLLSNTSSSAFTPPLAELVPTVEHREVYWQKLRNAGLLSSKFYVFSDAAEYRKHIASRDIYSPENE